MTSDLDQRERRELCDLFDRLGPEAPTLCGDWRTADLAAHLVVRERDPLGAPGILLGGPFETLTERRMAHELERGYEAVVERVRTGPPFGPMKIPPVRYAVNLIELTVHHEDVRRPNGLAARSDRPDLQDAVWGLLGRMATLMVLKSRLRGVRLVLERPDGTAISAGRGHDVVLTGEPVELLLYLYGRKAVADVALDGAPGDVERVEAAEFGV